MEIKVGHLLPEAESFDACYDELYNLSFRQNSRRKLRTKRLTGYPYYIFFYHLFWSLSLEEINEILDGEYAF